MTKVMGIQQTIFMKTKHPSVIGFIYWMYAEATIKGFIIFVKKQFWLKLWLILFLIYVFVCVFR